MKRLFLCILLLMLISCKDNSSNITDTNNNDNNVSSLLGKWKFMPSDSQSLEFNFATNDSVYITMVVNSEIDIIKGVYATNLDTINIIGYFSASEQFRLAYKYLIIHSTMSLSASDLDTKDFMGNCYDELLLPYSPPDQVIFSKQ